MLVIVKLAPYQIQQQMFWLIQTTKQPAHELTCKHMSTPEKHILIMCFSELFSVEQDVIRPGLPITVPTRFSQLIGLQQLEIKCLVEEHNALLVIELMIIFS